MPIYLPDYRFAGNDPSLYVMIAKLLGGKAPSGAGEAEKLMKEGSNS